MTQDQDDRDDLAKYPENYATICDHYREMARRFSESRDELKHETRELKAQLAAVVAERDALKVERDELKAQLLLVKSQHDFLLGFRDEVIASPLYQRLAAGDAARAALRDALEDTWVLVEGGGLSGERLAAIQKLRAAERTTS